MGFNKAKKDKTMDTPSRLVESDDEDESYQAKEKARFLAEAKSEVEKRQKLKEKQKRQEEEAALLAEEAKQKEAARMAVFRPSIKIVFPDASTPPELLALEAEGANGDTEVEEILGDLKTLRERIKECEDRIEEIQAKEERKLKRIEEKMLQYEQELLEESRGEISFYTDDQRKEQARQFQENQKIISSLRKENQKTREKIKSMKKEMREVTDQNTRMKQLIKTTKKHIKKLSKADEDETARYEKYQKAAAKYKRVIDSHEEALDFRTMKIDSERAVKDVYLRATTNIVMRFQNDCKQDSLVLQLGTLALEGMEDNKRSSLTSKAMKAGSDNTERTDSETETEACMV